MPKPDGCKAIVVGDQYRCRKCGYSWDITDPEPPKCKDTEKPKTK